VHNSAVLEAIAKMALLTEQINPSAPRLKDALIKKHFERNMALIPITANNLFKYLIHEKKS
jgi:ribulose-5-phosphate 4-epimerase/fuculose-1-phosphate aldolase